MIVEDSIADVRLVREALRDFSKVPVNITAFPDGEQALSSLDSGSEFDLIILDLSMPRVDGHTFLEQYKPQYPPIVVFTSSWNVSDRVKALALGAREFIRKPMSYEEYVQTVCGIVERWGDRNRTDFKSNPLRV